MLYLQLSFNNFSDTIGSNEMCMYILYRQGRHICFNLLWRICRNNTLKVWQVSTLHSRIGICYLVCTKMFLSSRNQNWSVNRDGILFPKLFRPTMSKSCSSDWEKLLKFKAEGGEFAKPLRSLQQFTWPMKGKNNLWKRMLF